MLEYSAALVCGPTSPSTLIPAEDWKARTAALVCGPNSPSTPIDCPLPFSSACRVRTQPPAIPSTMFDGQELDRRSTPSEPPLL